MIILFISLQKKDMMDTVKNRRTIRKYQQKDITSDIVQYLQKQNYSLLGKSIISGNLGNLFLVSH